MNRSHLAIFAPNIVGELIEGRTQSTFSIRPYLGQVTQVSLAHLVSCDLCDTSESVLRPMLQYLGAQAKAGDAQALALITKLADSIEAEYGTADREPDPQDRRDAAAEWLGVTQA